MTSGTSCPREADVLELVAIGQWPSRADRELSDHVAGCEICADLAAVASAMAELGENARAATRVPDASVVWYRAQMAAREDLARRATRPIFLAEIAAVTAVLAAVAVAWQFGGSWLVSWWNEVSDVSVFTIPGLQVTSEWVVGALTTWRWLAVGLLAWASLIPAAFYLARFADRTTEPVTGRGADLPPRS